MTSDDFSSETEEPSSGPSGAGGEDAETEEPPPAPSEAELEEATNQADLEQGGEGNMAAVAASANAICQDFCFYWNDRFWFRWRLCDLYSADNLINLVQIVVRILRQNGYPVSRAEPC
jgi:hypothetical protein